jgi:hypothetical protein
MPKFPTEYQLTAYAARVAQTEAGGGCPVCGPYDPDNPELCKVFTSNTGPGKTWVKRCHSCGLKWQLVEGLIGIRFLQDDNSVGPVVPIPPPIVVNEAALALAEKLEAEHPFDEDNKDKAAIRDFNAYVEALDEAVHACFSALASEVNNGGVSEQIGYLLDHGFTEYEIRERILAAIAEAEEEEEEQDT